MTRIIGGRAGGRRLATPRGQDTRPTSDRVREALFSAVESWCGSLSGLRVLDLYAGSGAVGLEAWSRGAAAVTFVESDRRTAAVVRANAQAVGCDHAQVLATSVAAALSRPSDRPVDLVFSDPPYPLPTPRVVSDLEALRDHGWLVPGALVVVERSVRGEPLAWPEGFEEGRRRRYGETVLCYGHAGPAGRSPEAASEAEEASDEQ
ncbi:MAG: 16S rRNA (guanine(966)-N(2))-methyltransferase RsmD [Nocardioidaceae bacterium]